jgi:hypothetical protein
VHSLRCASLLAGFCFHRSFEPNDHCAVPRRDHLEIWTILPESGSPRWLLLRPPLFARRVVCLPTSEAHSLGRWSERCSERWAITPGRWATVTGGGHWDGNVADDACGAGLSHWM